MPSSIFLDYLEGVETEAEGQHQAMERQHQVMELPNQVMEPQNQAMELPNQVMEPLNQIMEPLNQAMEPPQNLRTHRQHHRTQHHRNPHTTLRQVDTQQPLPRPMIAQLPSHHLNIANHPNPKESYQHLHNYPTVDFKL